MIRKCADCRLCMPDVEHKGDKQLEYARCDHPSATRILEERWHMGIDAVPEQTYCSIMRKYNCGKDATLFEPKEGSDG